MAQRLVARLKHLNDRRKLAISFLIELLLSSLLFLRSLSIIIASFKFYNLLNMARYPLRTLDAAVFWGPFPYRVLLSTRVGML